MSSAPTSPLPPELVAAWAAEIARARCGVPTWTVAGRARLCRAVRGHEAELAAALSTPFGAPGRIGQAGTVRFAFVADSRFVECEFDPTTGLYSGDRLDGRGGLLSLAASIWSLPGPPVGPIAAAHRLAELLGHAVLRSAGGAK